ncbi:NAD-dependent epimerase/dehydratase family protein [Archangium lansingense]|uniref:NAD-dependent epimerase/dehydratase family protein n=1 Tax=Archangium lansingense TaxID=2995310 RepID=A0ABT4A5I9_9BACT|nr:NAD-dependent epimerase/dehydratase family protein [Archangium lansinium]MCY1076885.1 NAD-dependent epimerase/dehydratase family protein [Archangium lansinium]
MSARPEWRSPRGVLVLGASTPVGARLCRTLLEDRALRTVMAVGLEPRERVDLPEDPRLSYHRVDLTHARPVHDLLFGTARDLGVDVVVHLALHRANDFGDRVHVQNVESLRWLLSLSERHPTLRRLVFRSHAEVYRVERGLPTLITEDHPLELSPDAPQWVRDRVEADLLACSQMGMMAGLELAVLRCAEVLAPHEGSQLHDYLRAPVCLRSAGFDPMLNVLTQEDATEALRLAVYAGGLQGLFNIPGADTLPLSTCIRLSGRLDLPMPGPLLAPVYETRRRLRGAQFSYRINRGRFHFAAVLDGTQARQRLGYEPHHRVNWPASR